MTNPHDGQSLMPPPDVVREWINPELSEDRETEIDCEETTHVNAFEWYCVRKVVGRIKHDEPDLLTQIGNPLL